MELWNVPGRLDHHSHHSTITLTHPRESHDTLKCKMHSRVWIKLMFQYIPKDRRLVGESEALVILNKLQLCTRQRKEIKTQHQQYWKQLEHCQMQWLYLQPGRNFSSVPLLVTYKINFRCHIFQVARPHQVLTDLLLLLFFDSVQQQQSGNV